MTSTLCNIVRYIMTVSSLKLLLDRGAVKRVLSFEFFINLIQYGDARDGQNQCYEYGSHV